MKAGHALAVAALLTNALVFGLSWWPFRRLESLGLHPLWATALMYAMAIGVMLALAPRAWRGFVSHPVLWWLVASSGLTNVGFNWAITIGDVVRVVLLFYLMPAWSIFIAWWLLGERPTRMAFVRLALALVGVALVLKTPDSSWPLPHSPADWLALMGGFFFATTNVLLLRLSATPAVGRVLAMFGGGAAMAALVAVWGVSQGRVTQWPAVDASWLLLAVAMSLALLAANYGLQYGAARLSAHSTALIMLSEVVFATLSSAWLGAAHLDARVALGGALIVLAAALSAWPAKVAPAHTQPHTL